MTDGRDWTTAPVARTRLEEHGGERWLATTRATATKCGWDMSRARPRVAH